MSELMLINLIGELSEEQESGNCGRDRALASIDGAIGSTPVA